MKIVDVLRTAAALTSEHGENPEYDRGLVELTSDLTGLQRSEVVDLIAREVANRRKPVKIEWVKAPWLKPKTLACQWVTDCASGVTHVDEKGYVYCATHGNTRKSHCRCRKLTPTEKRTLEGGGTIKYRWS